MRRKLGLLYQHGVLKPQVRLVLMFASTLLGAGFLLIFLLSEGYREAERQAEADARNIVNVLEARLGGTFERTQATLEHIAESLSADAMRREHAGRYRNGIVRELALHARHFDDIVGYRIADADGNLLYASGGEVPEEPAAGRSYFSLLRANPARSVVFSEVHEEREGGRSVVVVAVPVRDAGGAFLGIVFAPLDLTRLQAMFDAVSLGKRGVITLRRSDDGRLALRRPFVPGSVNQSLKGKGNPMHERIESGDVEGSIVYQAALDGIKRVYAYRRIDTYPYYVAVGIAAEDYLATWQRTSVVVGIASLLVLLLLALLMLSLVRQEREEAEIGRRLRASEARYRMLAENSHDVIWTIDVASRCFTYVSPSILSMTGYAPKEVIGRPFDLFLSKESAERMALDIDQRLRRLAAGDRSASVLVSELEQRHRDGTAVLTEVVSTWLFDEDGVVTAILGITRNVGERKRAEEALRESNRQLHAQIEQIGRLQVALQEQAIRDGLTGLFNRRFLDETLEREVSRARREGGPLSLVMLDIDHFKQVNDTYGHQLGDEALKRLAAALVADVRTEDVACRYGGEEFVILLPNMPLATAAIRAESWRQAVEALVVPHGEKAVRITISLGVAAYPEHGVTPDELTRCADKALYEAKAQGRNRVRVYSA